jgi:opacity protein-like surface antigen
LRKLLLLTCAFAALTSFAPAQQIAQINLAVGGSTVFSSKSLSSSEAFLVPPLKGGVYPSFSADVFLQNHFGFNAEFAFRDHQGLYNNYQRFRPIFYDVNGMYTHHVSGRASLDLLGGVGGETLLFYNQFGSCIAGACRVTLSSDHFLLHAGAGIRYRFWRNAFIRPEAHYYRIIDNTEFSSANILRLGASIGYSFVP